MGTVLQLSTTYGGNFMLSANTINITVTCIFSLPDIFIRTDFAPVSSMVYWMANQNTLEFHQHCLFGLVGNYLLSEVQSHVSEMQEVSLQSSTVTSD
jgi:hypothetical protein